MNGWSSAVTPFDKGAGPDHKEIVLSAASVCAPCAILPKIMGSSRIHFRCRNFIETAGDTTGLSLSTLLKSGCNPGCEERVFLEIFEISIVEWRAVNIHTGARRIPTSRGP
jgi:hypothetical protein